MSFYSLQTSERAVSAIINAGKIDPVVLNNERYQNLDWSQKLNTLIKDRLVDELQLTTLFVGITFCSQDRIRTCMSRISKYLIS